jgi:hypothetical protein
MSSPLSNLQKAKLAKLARRAFNRSAAIARGRGEDPAAAIAAAIAAALGVDAPRSDAPRSTLKTAFRHHHVAAACGKPGLTLCTQDDYKLVEAHFLDLLGESGRALNSLVDGAANPRRIAEHKLHQACTEFGFTLGYAEAICRRQNRGAGLQDVDAKTLWNLVFTIRNRGNARRRNQQEAA